MLYATSLCILCLLFVDQDESSQVLLLPLATIMDFNLLKPQAQLTVFISHLGHFVTVTEKEVRQLVVFEGDCKDPGLFCTRPP